MLLRAISFNAQGLQPARKVAALLSWAAASEAAIVLVQETWGLGQEDPLRAVQL